jgi:hypothetical protein
LRGFHQKQPVIYFQILVIGTTCCRNDICICLKICVAKTVKVRIIQRHKDTAFYQKQPMSKRIISKTTTSRYFGNFWFRFPNLISSDKIKIKNNFSPP